MKMTLGQARRAAVSRVVVESVDLSLYIARLELEDGSLALLAGDDGRALRTHNLLAMKALLAPLAPIAMVLRQQSSYDEMCGHGYPAADNTLEVPLGGEVQPQPRWLH